MINKFVCSLFLFVSLFLQPVVYAASEPAVIILNVDEPFAGNIPAIATQSFTGNDPNAACAYFELLLKAKNTAITLGANVVKINKHIPRNRNQPCDEVNVSFYLADNIKSYEKRFSWTEDRKLAWDDFKGGVPGRATQKTAAETSCGIAIETNTVRGNNPVRIYVFNTFVTDASWVRPEHMTAAILKHEQGHFDICELYTRKMRERFSTAKLDFNNMQQLIREIYNSVMTDYAKRQQEYEAATQHGVVDEAQAKWSEQIAKELAATDNWKST